MAARARRGLPAGPALTSLAATTVVLVALGAVASIPTSAFVPTRPTADAASAATAPTPGSSGRLLVTGGIGIPPSAPPEASVVADRASDVADAARAALAAVEPEPVKDLRPRIVAQRGDLQLRMPSVTALAAGFHEAATSNALPMRPHGHLLRNLNATHYDAPPDAADGVTYLVMSSRGRSAPATSALDVMMHDDDPVLSPVDGVVADVRQVMIEQRHPDLRIELHPDGADDLRVVIVHVDGVRVTAGDRVEAGVTVLASTARRFPFLSQIDNLTYPELWPHVHLEVQARDARRPGDPPPEPDPGDDPDPVDD